MRFTFALLVVLYCFLLSLPSAFAVPVYDENNDGDLSGDPFFPTMVEVEPGQNEILAFLDIEIDVVSFEIEAGESLESVTLVNYVPGAQDGSSGVLIYSGEDVTGPLLGVTVMSEAVEGQDLLGLALISPPLTSGIYTLILSEVAIENNSYVLSINVGPNEGPPPITGNDSPVVGSTPTPPLGNTPPPTVEAVPEPATVMLLMLGLVGLLLIRNQGLLEV